MKIIPLVVGSLGAIPKQFGNRLKQNGITATIAIIIIIKTWNPKKKPEQGGSGIG